MEILKKIKNLKTDYNKYKKEKSPINLKINKQKYKKEKCQLKLNL